MNFYKLCHFKFLFSSEKGTNNNTRENDDDDVPDDNDNDNYIKFNNNYEHSHHKNNNNDANNAEQIQDEDVDRGISIEVLQEAVFQQSNNKSLWLDGLCAEIFKHSY